MQKDKRSGRPKIWIYRDKATNTPKGDATVTYEDPFAAAAAVEWFNNKEFHGNVISVFIAETKSKDLDGSTGYSGVDHVMPDSTGLESVEEGGHGEDNSWSGGRGRGDPGGKAWQQDGDWPCPNPRSVMTLVSSSFGTPMNVYSIFIIHVICGKIQKILECRFILINAPKFCEFPKCHLPQKRGKGAC